MVLFAGYAINSGMYFGAGEDEYNAVSAPRWNGSGAVLVYFSLTHDFPGKHKLLIPGLQVNAHIVVTWYKRSLAVALGVF